MARGSNTYRRPPSPPSKSPTVIYECSVRSAGFHYNTFLLRPFYLLLLTLNQCKKYAFAKKINIINYKLHFTNTRSKCVFCELLANSATRTLSLFFFLSFALFYCSDKILACLKSILHSRDLHTLNCVPAYPVHNLAS